MDTKKLNSLQPSSCCLYS
uniref:Uncharacterized protein n=1 Tax=Arundo donax TaxID=35708 RepID=A0A0A9AYI1_ARUDO